ncbi:MAG: YbbR-like domain-containing protein [Bacteroidota bacterium]|nr:YbbR-like domain-containing protein [Bacteroidota bacterium]
MENGKFQKWPKVSEGQKLQSRKRILLFSVFLLISASIWLLNALSKNYTTVIEYPLVYTDFPKDKVSVGDMPGHLDLQINSHGYALLRYKLFRKPVPISFNVSEYNLNTGQDGSSAYILTRYLKEPIARQLPTELQLLEIAPDTLHFQFAGRVTRMVRIKPDFNYSIDKQFTIKDEIMLTPDSVEVTGPDILLDTLAYVYTEGLDLGELTKNYEDKVRLSRMAEMAYSVSRVECFIELERFTELQVTVPIEVLNLPDSIVLQTFPSNIMINCKVGLSKYERIESYPFRAVVDYEKIDERVQTLNVSIQNLPDYLLGYEYSPKTVEFLKSRK